MLITPPHTSGFYATRDTAQAMTNGAYTTVEFDSVHYDLHNEYDSSTGLFTPIKDGYYLCDWMVTSANTSFTSNEIWLSVLVKNSESSPSPGNRFLGFRWASQGSQTVYATSNGCAIVDLDADDTLSVDLLQNGGAVNVHASGFYNYFSVRKLGLS